MPRPTKFSNFNLWETTIHLYIYTSSFQEGNPKGTGAGSAMCQKMSQQGRRLAWLNRKPWLEFGKKSQVYHLWEKERATCESYKDAMGLGREKIRRAKGQPELIWLLM